MVPNDKGSEPSSPRNAVVSHDSYVEPAAPRFVDRLSKHDWPLRHIVNTGTSARVGPRAKLDRLANRTTTRRTDAVDGNRQQTSTARSDDQFISDSNRKLRSEGGK